MLPGTQEIRTFVVRDGRLVAVREHPTATLPDEQARLRRPRARTGRWSATPIPGEGAGFQDTITLIYGYDPSRRVIVGMQVLDSRETPGLGDKIITDDEFLANFEALAVEPSIVAVKKGKKAEPNEVDCITGATISSEAVVTILNQSSQQLGRRCSTPAGRDERGESKCPPAQNA